MDKLNQVFEGDDFVITQRQSPFFAKAKMTVTASTASKQKEPIRQSSQTTARKTFNAKDFQNQSYGSFVTPINQQNIVNCNDGSELFNQFSERYGTSLPRQQRKTAFRNNLPTSSETTNKMKALDSIIESWNFKGDLRIEQKPQTSYLSKRKTNVDCHKQQMNQLIQIRKENQSRNLDSNNIGWQSKTLTDGGDSLFNSRNDEIASVYPSNFRNNNTFQTIATNHLNKVFQPIKYVKTPKYSTNPVSAFSPINNTAYGTVTKDQSIHVDTKVVDKQEFDRIVKESQQNEEIAETTIYVIKPIIVPVSTMKPKPLTKIQRQWRAYNQVLTNPVKGKGGHNHMPTRIGGGMLKDNFHDRISDINEKIRSKDSKEFDELKMLLLSTNLVDDVFQDSEIERIFRGEIKQVKRDDDYGDKYKVKRTQAASTNSTKAKSDPVSFMEAQ